LASIQKNVVKISGGRGYKAPDFRQLYLNYTNPSEGYSVLGSEEVQSQFQALLQQGQINQALLDVDALSPLKAESSIAFNATLETTFNPFVKSSIGFFRNDLRNMITSMPVAIKTNGQSVYSYFNIDNVFTQGLETELLVQPTPSLKISGGYQYLIAKDKQVLEDLEAGNYFSRDPNTFATTKLTKSDYHGLFNRSKHMGNIKISYSHVKKQVDLTLRGIYRGRYGFGDLNGNLILDQKEEFVPGYWVWNFSLTKKLFKQVNCQLGINNLFGFTAPLYIPSLPGRLYYASITSPLWNKKKEPIKNR
jgi:outer membrane receptor for ferrienterochelin and colicins